MRTSAATAGRNDTATAGAWRAGEARKAWAVICNPTKTRIGATAASGRSRTSTATTPTAAPTPIRRPVASV